MKIADYLEIIGNTPLFRGLETEHVLRLLQCLGAQLATKQAGAYFFLQGEYSEAIYTLVSGEAVGERISAHGDVTTINTFAQGDIFGDVLSGSSVASAVSVRAKTDCMVVQFAFDNMISPCVGSERQQSVVLRNLINEISNKYFAMHERMSILLRKNLRQKIALYLLLHAKKSGKDTFHISHNREEMAQHLNCERSALSRELSRMQKAGLIDARKNQFTLLDKQELMDIAG